MCPRRGPRPRDAPRKPAVVRVDLTGGPGGQHARVEDEPEAARGGVGEVLVELVPDLIDRLPEVGAGLVEDRLDADPERSFVAGELGGRLDAVEH